MLILNRVGRFGAVTVVVSTPLFSVAAQQQSPSTPPSASPPAVAQPAPAPMPLPNPGMRPAVPGSVVAPIKNPLLGLPVFSSDGSRLAVVDSVDAQPDGKVTAINIRTGGFLGLGTKLVAIPEDKFTRTGDFLRLSMTADEVSKLPEIKDRT